MAFSGLGPGWDDPDFDPDAGRGCWGGIARRGCSCLVVLVGVFVILTVIGGILQGAL